MRRDGCTVQKTPFVGAELPQLLSPVAAVDRTSSGRAADRHTGSLQLVADRHFRVREAAVRTMDLF